MPLVTSLLLALQVGTGLPSAAPVAAAQPPASPADSAPRRRGRRPPRNIPVTPELERTAFADAAARALLARARVARLSQDSALRAYEAKTYQRLSVGMGLRRFGRDRLLMRTEQAAHVRWDRDRGVVVQPTGQRSVFPAFKEAEGEADMSDVAPIPYFPGRETLWFPSSSFGVAKAEVDDREFVHPLARGAEAYYRFATGDSVRVRLPDGRSISLREIRITARRPDWHLFVGSFWFDVDGGQLVRAAYRMSEPLDIWQVVDEETRREYEEAVERVQNDTSAAARAVRREAQREMGEDAPPKWVKGLFHPMRATISMITVEYGLHEGRFWLPRRNVAEGDAQAGFLHVPVKVEETFRYDRVSGEAPRAIVATPAPQSAPRPALAAARTALDSALALEPPDSSTGSTEVVVTIGDGPSQARASERIDSTIRVLFHRADSLSRRADSLQAVGDTARARRTRALAVGRLRRAATIARREQQCAVDSTYDAGIRRRFEGELAIRMRLPCDTTGLATSPDLPKSAYEPGEQLFGGAELDELRKALDLSLQPGWAPQPVRFHSGLDLMRYNRVEGLSVAGSATSALGAGYSVQGLLRLGVADLVPNAELSLSRDNGRRTIRLGAFHRLGVANDDWGAPLSFGSSLANLLYARDEGFYYRTFGAELSGTREAPLFGAAVQWRLFGERQRTAGVEPNTQISLGNLFGDTRFGDNVDAQQVTVGGAGADLSRSFGEDPTGLRLLTRTRVEAAAAKGATLGKGDLTGYGRLVVDATVSRGLGGIAVALTGAAGATAGDAPIQRQFFIGGAQTVRGQFARPSNAAGGVTAGYQGDAFWLGRAELGTNSIAARPVVFFDAGWAGPRADWSRPGRPLTGAGVGASFLDGMIRADLSRGIYPEKKVRFDLYVEARF